MAAENQYDHPDGVKTLFDHPGEVNLRRAWRRAEQYVCEEFGLEDVDETTYDAESPTGSDRHEVKSCAVPYLLKIHLPQMNGLLKASRTTAFVVYKPKTLCPVVALHRCNIRDLPFSEGKLTGENEGVFWRFHWTDIVPFEEVNSPFQDEYREFCREDETG